jgi:hypothetical protein
MAQKSVYVPVLRSHAAECDAFRQLDLDVRLVTAPLFEVSKTAASSMDGWPATAVARKVTNLTFGSAGPGELYVDLSELLDRSDATEICVEIQRFLLALHSDAQFVVRLDDLTRKGGVKSALKLVERNGSAFRVTSADYANAALWDVRSLLRQLGTDASSVDLLVDCQVVGERQPMRGTAARFESELPWRSITYLGGSFPPNLSNLKKNDQHELRRHEWIAFSSEKHNKSKTRFGDYTVQHPFQADPLPKSLPSGSIRYASDEYWVVMRGEKLDSPNGPGHQQYIAQAQLLCERPEYRGRTYSAGDEYIQFISEQTKRTGSPKTWLQAAINHHLTLAAHQAQLAHVA